jgi:chemotaxis protein MotB
MADKPKPPEEEGGEGAPLWIISFADMISLLMAFFVMLSTFSSFGPADAAKMGKVGKSALAPNYYGGTFASFSRKSTAPPNIGAGQDEKGSEKPTLDEESGKGLLAETEPRDFKSRKVFLFESGNMFWAQGTTLSASGRNVLDMLAAYVKKVPDRIVVTENGPGPAAVLPASASLDASRGGRRQEDAGLGILRAISVVEYLNAKGVARDRCNIGTRGMLSEQNIQAERMLEISLLGEGTYK